LSTLFVNKLVDNYKTVHYNSKRKERKTVENKGHFQKFQNDVKRLELEWHSRGQRFDPAYLHHFLSSEIL